MFTIDNETKIERMQDNLRSLRKIAKLSANDFANILGFTKQSISNFETRKIKIKQAQYLAIRAMFENLRVKDNNIILTKVLTLIDLVDIDYNKLKSNIEIIGNLHMIEKLREDQFIRASNSLLDLVIQFPVEYKMELNFDWMDSFIDR